MCNLANLDKIVDMRGTSQGVTVCSVKCMSYKAKKEVLVDWYRKVAGRPWMREGSSKKDVKEEAE